MKLRRDLLALEEAGGVGAGASKPTHVARMRVFRRVHLDCVLALDELPAARDDGRIGYTHFSCGHGQEMLAEDRDDFADALAASMERQDPP